jgi:hypothetical protein
LLVVAGGVAAVLSTPGAGAPRSGESRTAADPSTTATPDDDGPIALATLRLASDDSDAAPAVPSPLTHSPRVTLRMLDAPLASVLAEIQRQSGQAVQLEGESHDPVSLSVRDMPWADAAETVAALALCRVTKAPEGLVLRSMPKVTIQFSDAGLRGVIQLLAAYGGQKVDVTPGDLPNTSLDLKDVDADLAIVAITHTVGLVTYRDPDQIYVRRPGEAVPGGASPMTFSSVLARIPRVHANAVKATAPSSANPLSDEETALGVLVDDIAQRSGQRIRVEDPTLHQEHFSITDLAAPWESKILALVNEADARAEWRAADLVLTRARTITIQFHDANIRTVYQLLAAYTGLNLVIHPSVRGVATLSIREEPWDLAATLLADSANADVRRVGSLLLVTPAGSPGHGEPLKAAKLWDGSGAGREIRASLSGAFDATRFADEIETQTGERVRFVSPPAERFHLELKDVTASIACAAFANAANLRVDRNDREHVLSPMGRRTQLHLYGVQGRTLLGFLANQAGLSALVTRRVAGRLDAQNLSFNSLDEAIRHCARLLGATLRECGGVYLVTAPAAATPRRNSVEVEARPPTILMGEDSVAIPALEAVDLHPDAPKSSSALLSGRAYRVGDRLLDLLTGEDGPLKVLRVEADRVLCEHVRTGSPVWLVAKRGPDGWVTAARR